MNQTPEDLKEYKEKLKELRKEVNDIFSDISDKVQKIDHLVYSFKDKLNKIKEEEVEDWSRSLRDQITDKIESQSDKTIYKTRKLFEKNFINILNGDSKKFQKDLLKDLEKFRNTTLNKIIKTFFIGQYGKTGEIGGIIGQFMPNFLKAGNTTAQNTSELKNINSNWLSKLKYNLFHFPASHKKAIGGTVNTNTPYLVGESGPELFIPDSYGSVIPNHNLNASSKNINVTLNINTSDYGAFTKHKHQIVSELTKTLKKHSRKF